MDVVLGVVRQVVVDDVGDALDVQAAGGDIGRDEHRNLAAGESFEQAQTLFLRYVTRQDRGGVAVALEEAPDPVGLALGVDEHDHARLSSWRIRPISNGIFSSFATM
jgi:hypothetical protein